ncbi:hypothetical protein JMUB7533_17950 [Staphylococcus aureus]
MFVGSEMCIRDRDIVADEISMEEYLDPFTGEKNKKRKKKE